ncbi:PQQ-dependent sugar dehydrogenase [Flavobacteriaceae bacterium XHP0103]|uniref:PQQ-dependent sugar dehydrogenase n=1 Tax=Marixanthotalea marina TaxID=2844359 RepID=UPI002989E6E3|nr:PQQ-dependent sugar dehydrogenase [Marixanthotalea marina]MBU3822831.1 PQQ-dependent sugar dehydrogenase [Marixanthotalea marina]
MSLNLYSQGTLSVSGNGNPVNSGSTSTSLTNNTNFGSVEIGTDYTLPFLLSNTSGNGSPKQRLNNIIVTISGSSDFTPTSTNHGDLRGNDTPISHFVTFTPSSPGTKTATVTITFSNGTNAPYTFAIEGTGIEPTPEINITDSSNSTISNGDTFDFGTVPPNATVSEEFKINNTTANTTLTLQGNPYVSISGDSEFSIISQPSSGSIAGNTFETFTIQYITSSAGQSHSATLIIDNDDPDGGEDPYTITLQGTCNEITYTPITDGPDWTVSNLTPDFELDAPNTIVYGPDDNLWITERAGKRVVKLDPVAGGNKTVMLDLTGVVYQTASQDGLMGMAVHPDLYTDINTSNNYVYLAYTYNSSGRKLRIARYTYNAGTGLLDSGSATTILEGFDASDDHNSGKLIFGPDMKLYYTAGDQGANQYGNACNEIRAQYLPTSGGQTQTSIADKAEYKGKILRMELDGSIPTDNPVLGGFRTHIFSYGHRNPQGIVFGSNGKLYSSEHGPKVDDEINIIEAGKNYGWPAIAGYHDGLGYEYCNWSTSTSCGSFSENGCPPDAISIAEDNPVNDAILANFAPPIGTYNSTAVADPFGGFFAWPTVAPSSIAIYEGGVIPGWGSSLLIPTLKKGTIFRVKLNALGDGLEAQVYEEFHSSNDRYRDVVVSPDGRTFYAITDSSGSTSGPSGTTPQTIENPGVVVKIEYTGVSENPNTTYYVDADGDGYGDSADTGTEYTSDPGAGFSTNNTDCDDSEPLAYPGNTEVPYDGIDNDCDPLTLDDDLDGDGFIQANDCDDNDPAINPNTVWYLGVDSDNDTFFGSVTSITQCESPGPEYSTTEPEVTDCDDSNPEVNPSTTEIPGNGIDDDCNPVTQDDDLDGDGYVAAEDCDDNNAAINPGATEILYDGIDNDCNPATLDTEDADGDGVNSDTDCDDNNPAISSPITYYIDNDNDGFGSTATEDLCETTAPLGYSTNNTDCDDNDSAINTPQPYFVDADGDGYGSTVTALVCSSTPPVGYSLNNTDCDDTNFFVNPGVSEVVGNGIDDDCNPATSDDEPACQEILNDNSFENGLINWMSGGKDASLSNSFASSGIYSVQLRNAGTGASIYTNSIDLSSYSEVAINFTYYASNMNAGEGFFLEISTNGGSSYSIYKTWSNGSQFENNIAYSESTLITGVTLTSNTRFRIRCNASNRGDQVYLDDVIVTSCTDGASAKTAFGKIGNPSNGSINIYPNPASSSLFVDYVGFENKATLSIYTVTGQLVKSSQLEDAKGQIISINTFAEGLYLIRVTNNQGELLKTDRIIIKAK